jgi:hypothetical protein
LAKAQPFPSPWIRLKNLKFKTRRMAHNFAALR